jgi:AcrR family transcriptional regulator
MTETKIRILDAAERLVASEGFDVSLRSITAAAGVNLAAVNYHFQSKDALIDAIAARRIEPINRRRIEMLDALEREAGDGPLPLEGVLEALIAPLTLLHADGLEHLRPLIGRLYSHPHEFARRIFPKHLAPVVARFSRALERAVPELPEQERMWCLSLSVGMMIHVLNWSEILPLIAGGLIDYSDPKAITDRLISFAAAGIRARAQSQELHKSHA